MSGERVIPAWRRAGAGLTVLVVLATSLVALAAAPAAAAEFVTPTRIMPLGASYTWGVGGDGGGGYRPPLVQSLVSGRYNSDMVGSQRHGPATLYDRDHEGHPGYRIDEIAAIAPGRLTTYRPDFVLLLVGTNDVLQQYELDTAPDRLSDLIDLIHATRSNSHVIVASLLPLADPDRDADVRTYNAAIPGIVADKSAAGRPVSFVDLYPVITVADLVDGVHPNQAGYNKIAAAWDAALAELRGAPPPVSNRTCPCTIWSPGDVPVRAQVSSTTAAEVGVKFRTEKAGFITGVRFYKGEANTGTHVGKLWRATGGSTGTLLSSATFTDETPSGWQEVSFPEPVPVQANTVYIASYYASAGRYAADTGYFRDREVVHSPLRVPSQGSINGNGVIRSGSPGLPNEPSPQHDTNYWVDVVFTTSAPATPPAPATVSASAVSASQVDVSWSAVPDATGYRVERSTDAMSWTPVATPPAGSTTHSDSGLEAATTYHYRIFATNAAGDSPPSPITTATTESAGPVSPPPAPAMVTATAVSASRVDVSWSAVADVTGYRVERSTDGTAWSMVATPAPESTSYSDTGLAEGTTYHYRVFAVNRRGDSPPSEVASATTAPVPPAAPSSLTATAVSSSQIDLSWSNVTEATGYRVERSIDGSAWGTAATSAAGETSYKDPQLRAATTYHYRVVATNAAGDSPPSPTASATTLSAAPTSPPPAPRTLSANAVSSSRIDLSWSDVQGETAYHVQRNVRGNAWHTVATTAADETFYADTGLAASTTYRYRVLASNAAGDSPPSPTASATTLSAAPTSPPPAPETLSATAVSSSRIDLVWSDVEGETGYRVQRSTDGVGWSTVATTSADVATYSDTGLLAATTYFYRVVATNGSGDSVPSPVASATTATADDGGDTIPPSAPTNLKATTPKGRVNLSWTGSTDAGGSGLAGYTVWRSTAGVSGPFTAVDTTSSTSFSDTTVSGGATYWYRITAFDGAGNQSQPSNVVSATAK